MTFFGRSKKPCNKCFVAWFFIVVASLTLTLGSAGNAVPPDQQPTKDTGHTVRKLPKHLMPKNVISSLKRKATDSSVHPWRTIGRVNIGGTAHCSGSLVADNIVLTAAHCLYSKQLGKMVPANMVHFLAGYSHGEYLAHSKVIAYETGRDNIGAVAKDLQNAPYDWALLILQDPIGQQIGALPIHDGFQIYAKDDAVFHQGGVKLSTQGVAVAGYPMDRSHVLSLEKDCAIKNMFSGGTVLVIDCTALPGDSGGPILQIIDGKWVLIGLQTAAIQNDKGRFTLGVSGLGFRRALSALINAKE